MNGGPPTTGSVFKYWAFISYSHNDERWARWLHRSIESYVIPRSIRSSTTPKKLFPVFRDRDELAGAAELSEKIEEALHLSQALIVRGSAPISSDALSMVVAEAGQLMVDELLDWRIVFKDRPLPEPE